MIRKYKNQGLLADSRGRKLSPGQICKCEPGTEVKRPYRVRIVEDYNPKLYIKGKQVKPPVLCTELICVFKEGHRAVIWPNWSRRLTILNQ